MELTRDFYIRDFRSPKSQCDFRWEPKDEYSYEPIHFWFEEKVAVMYPKRRRDGNMRLPLGECPATGQLMMYNRNNGWKHLAQDIQDAYFTWVFENTLLR